MPWVEGELGGVLEEGEEVCVGRASGTEKRRSDNTKEAQDLHAEPACGAPQGEETEN